MLASQQRPIFDIENRAIAPVINARNSMIATVAALAIGGTIAPVLLPQLPKLTKTMLHLLGAGNAIALSGMTFQTPKEKKIKETIENAQLGQLRSHMVHEIALQDVSQQMMGQMQMAAMIMQLQEPHRSYYLHQYGLGYLVQQPQAIDVVPNQLRSAEPIAPRFEQQPVEPIIFEDGTVTFAEEDLAFELARITTDPKLAGSTLIACPTGTGKSNLLRAALTEIDRAYNGKFDPYIFSGKDGETYCGLEKTDKYLYSGEIANVETTRYRASAIAANRCKKFAGFPTICVWDEYNNTLAAAEMHDKANKTQEATLLSGSTYERITKGRSKLCLDIITSHSPYVQDIKINTAIQQSLNIIVLGRGNKYGAIKDVLSGKRQIIEDTDRREELYALFQSFMKAPDRDRVLALTNLNGDWRLVFLPRYPDEQPELGMNTVTSDDVQVEEVSDRPVAESKSKAKAETKIANDSYKPFFDWLDDCKENGVVPTIEAGRMVLMQNGFPNVKDESIDYLIRNPERFR
jgi:hypothetical protein